MNRILSLFSYLMILIYQTEDYGSVFLLNSCFVVSKMYIVSFVLFSCCFQIGDGSCLNEMDLTIETLVEQSMELPMELPMLLMGLPVKSPKEPTKNLPVELQMKLSMELQMGCLLEDSIKILMKCLKERPIEY